MSEQVNPRRLAASTREVAIIVLGVLIALGADSAWGSWQERGQERAYLVTLAADLDGAENRVRAAMQEDGANREGVFATYDLLRRGEDQDWMAALEGFGYSEFSPHVTAVEVLIETGDLSLLRSSELRARIIDLRNQLRVTERWLDRTETQIWAAHSARTLSLEALEPGGALAGQSGSPPLRAAY